MKKESTTLSIINRFLSSEKILESIPDSLFTDLAEKIIKLADENKVTVFQSPLLARALYFTGEIGKEISEYLYSAVAAVLAYIFKIERGEETDYPEFEIPENMSFDEYGKKIK